MGGPAVGIGRARTRPVAAAVDDGRRWSKRSRSVEVVESSSTRSVANPGPDAVLAVRGEPSPSPPWTTSPGSSSPAATGCGRRGRPAPGCRSSSTRPGGSRADRGVRPSSGWRRPSRRPRTARGVRTDFSAQLALEARRWTRGAVLRPPAGLVLTARGPAALGDRRPAGRRGGYLLGTGDPDDQIHRAAGAQLARSGWRQRRSRCGGSGLAGNVGRSDCADWPSCWAKPPAGPAPTAGSWPASRPARRHRRRSGGAGHNGVRFARSDRRAQRHIMATLVIVLLVRLRGWSTVRDCRDPPDGSRSGEPS